MHKLRATASRTLSGWLCLGVAAGGLFVAATTSSTLGAATSTADPADQVSQRVVVIGDSYTGGSGEGGVGPMGWPELSWSELLRTDDLYVTPEVSGRGGSGYVSRGTDGTTLPDEAARLVSPDDRVIVYFGGLNDNSVDPVLVRDAVHRTFAETRATAPCARLVVIGPVWPNAEPSPTIVGVSDTLRDEAARVGAMFVDPIAERWFDDDPSLIGADHVHPTDAGHEYMAQRIEPVLRDALRSGPAC